jgi:hypothetical protein
VIVSLCESCVHLREVISGKGSRFLLCLLSRSDERFPKYPAQPVVRCTGHEPRRGDEPTQDEEGTRQG